MFVRAGYTALDHLASALQRQHNIDKADGTEFIEDPTSFVTEAGLFTHTDTSNSPA